MFFSQIDVILQHVKKLFTMNGKYVFI